MQGLVRHVTCTQTCEHPSNLLIYLWVLPCCGHFFPVTVVDGYSLSCVTWPKKQTLRSPGKGKD